MKVINNGKGLIIEASYFEAASITEALRKSAFVYDSENAPEFADVARELVHELMNEQIIKVGDSNE